MSEVFLVLGYGLPKNILRDEQYQTYLKLVFNNIYSLVTRSKRPETIIIFSGGQTDIYPPFKRDEAREMIRYFRVLAGQPMVKKLTSSWRIINESQALSTLENILYTKKYLQSRKLSQPKLYIFCEATRQRKVKIFAREIFGRKYNVKILPIDFDVSASRYLAPDFIKQKEAQEIKLGLWALQNKLNLKKFQQLYQQRLAYFRQQGAKKHLQSIHSWWTEQLNKLTT